MLKCVYPVPRISFRLLREANAKPEIPALSGTLAYDILLRLRNYRSRTVKNNTHKLTKEGCIDTDPGDRYRYLRLGLFTRTGKNDGKANRSYTLYSCITAFSQYVVYNNQPLSIKTQASPPQPYSIRANSST